MKTSSSRINVSWSQFGADLEELIKDVDYYLHERKMKPSGIYAPARGGLPLGVRFSHYFKVPLLHHPSSKCIIVDDIMDSGKTIEGLTQYCKPLCIATLYVGQNLIRENTDTPHFYIRNDQGLWVHFPWEQLDV